jgi:hypothetical protein
MSVTMAPSSLFISMPLMISALANLTVDLKRQLDSNPNTPIISMAAIKGYILKGCTHEMQDHARIIKADLEVYVGIFLVIGILFGASNIMAAMFFWQMMRMRYMISPAIQSSFAKIDHQLQMYLNHPYCPAMVRNVYMGGKKLIGNMTDMN